MKAKNKILVAIIVLLVALPGVLKAQLPTVVTHGPSDIYETIIVVLGEVSDEGVSPVTDRGMCLSLSLDPDLGDIVNHHGSGPGFFSSQFSWLMHSTTYYYCAFATNSEGTAYGEILSATTMSSSMTLTETISHVSCFGIDDGSIDISVSGGLPPYIYSWSNGYLTQNISSLAPGIYSVNVTDSEYDQIAGTYEVLEPPELEIIGVIQNVETCNGDATGSIQIDISGGTPPYTIEWEHGPTIVYVSDLEAGTYDVLVTDINGCEQSASFNVLEPDVLTIEVVNISDETCVGCDDGSIIATASGGTGPYTYHWTGPDGFSSIQVLGTIVGLSTGDYYVEVTDINSCTTETLHVFVGNPLVVTNTDDSGDGSLRDAIEYANSRSGADEIQFNIPGSWVHSIKPSDVLPEIIDPLIINGFSQPGSQMNSNPVGTGFNTRLQVVLDGINAGAGAEGLIVASDGCTITGLVITHFTYSGIALTSDNNLVKECFIGTDSLGIQHQDHGNDIYGIRIFGADNNEIRSCVISGNGESGTSPNIGIGGGSTQNQIFGNLIGTDLSGTQAVLNTAYGISLSEATNNVIGGLSDEDRNILFGGMTMIGTTCTNNRVIGNYIGPDVSGQNALGAGGGIVVSNGASYNEIGPGNVISGNPFAGITLRDEQTNYNGVFGNYLGVAADGNTAMGNNANNVQLISAWYNRIGGLSVDSTNVISGSSGNGISIDAFSHYNDIVGNRIGTNAIGSTAVGNQALGIAASGTDNNIGPGNLISGNIQHGINIGNAGAIKVFNNLIGVNASNNGTLSNGGNGIRIAGGNFHSIEGNTICGSSVNGILMAGSFLQNISIIANYIGTNENSLPGLGNSNDGIQITTDGDYMTVSNNTISGNGGNGISINDFSTSGISITGNKIGTNVDGTAALGNQMGIQIQDAVNTIIGGTAEADRNIISGNGEPGIHLTGSATGNIIMNNYIGTDITGIQPIPNEIGVLIDDNANNNYVGNGANGPGNLIAFNNTPGIGLENDQNFVQGNVIHGNGAEGIHVSGTHNTIGGPTDADKNFLYGNRNGIYLLSFASSNLIEGNYFGTDHEGRLDLTEGGTGVLVYGSDNIIRNNLISGYEDVGIHISRYIPEDPAASRNRIEGNLIGLNADGANYIPNGQGIRIDSSADNSIISNVIAGNLGNGITLYDARSVNSRFSQNLIFNNGELGIDLNWDNVTVNDYDPHDIDEGPNHLQNFPSLDTVNFAEGKVTVRGSLRSNNNSTYIIEFFASGIGDNSTYGEGEFYLGSDTVHTDDSGYASFIITLPTHGYGAQVITATATDEDGNTSEFSQLIGDVKDQVLAEMPFRYTLNSEGLPTVPLADYQNAIRSSFQTWDDISTAEIEMVETESSDQKYASATDTLNLVSFQDDRFPFARGVLAVTAKTIRISSGGTVAEILDADIIFNPAYIYDQDRPFAVLDEGDTDTEAFDIQTVATHEIGHVLGMIHSGVYSSTMFFMLGTGTTERELDADDMAWASYRYPNGLFQPNYGFISGRVAYGDIGDVAVPSSHPPVAGALVLAIDTLTHEMIHAYTDADGNYTVPIPLEGIGSAEYWIYIQPLDGDVYGTALNPANISPYIYSHTIFTDFPEEFYDELESADDNPRAGAEILVSAGAETAGIDLITNRDLTPPTVIGTSLDVNSEDVAVSPTIVIKFSEPVDIYSFNETTCFLERTVDTVGGEYTLLADSTHIVLLKPVEALQYSRNYKLNISGITDLKGNELAAPYFSSFTTQAPDTLSPSVYDVIPAHEKTQVDVSKAIKVFFTEPMNKSSVETAWTLMTIDSALVTGDYEWDLANKEISYLPDYSLQEGTEYVISISTQALDLAGNAMEDDTTFKFSTVDVAIPQILYLGPQHESTGITVETPVVVKFSEPMDVVSINASSFSLSGIAGPVTGTYEYLDQDRTIIFRPDQSLNFDEMYTVSLSNDISDKSDTKQYLQDTTATFHTAPEITVPHIDYMEPAFGAVDAQTTIVGSGFDPVPLNNIVMFNGSAATVSKATLESVTVKVPYDADDGPVTVSVNGVATDNSFEFDVVPPNTDPSYNLIASSTTGSRTRAVVINPDAGYAYVTNWGDNTVTPIDISGYIPVPGDDIPVGIEPMDIDLNPNGTLAYVTNYLSNSVSVIATDPGVETTFNQVVKDIPVGYHPYGVAASSDKKVYVANNESEYVSVIDVDPSSGGFDHVIANVKTGSKNRSIVVTPDAALILVTGEDGVNIIDRDPISPTFNDVIASASKGSSTRHITITPDAALALATTDDGVILIIDIFQPRGIAFGSVIASVKTGSSARNINISPDAMYVYITNPDENTVSVYQLDYSIVIGYGASLSNPEGLIHVATIEVDDTPYAIVGHPNSEYILVTHDSDQGGVSKIGIEGLSIDPIESLNELIASVKDARQDRVIPWWLGSRLLYNLNQTLNRVNWDLPGAAILSLDRFIAKVKRNIRYGRIPEDLGNAWLEAAYRIRDQLVKDYNDKVGLKSSQVEGYGINSLKDSNNVANRELIGTPTLKVENRPNPFSYHTQVHFEIPDKGQTDIPVVMRVFNTSGQVVKTLVHMDMEPGRYSVLWNSDLDDGGLVPDGIYLLELRIPGQRKAITISVIK